MAAVSRSLAAALLLALGASCTLTRTAVDSCKSNADCRAAFGSGLVCAADGLCEKAPPSPRCTETFPPDLTTRPESYPGILVYGSIIVGNVESQRARQNATRLAATQVNEQGGLDGRLFGVVFCDIQEDPKFDSLKQADAAIASARYLADVVGVPAIVGPSASGDTLRVFEAVRSQDVLVISPSATSPELTGADLIATATDERPGLLWRTAAPDTVQGAVIASYLGRPPIAAAPAITNVTVIHERGAYGEGLERVFRFEFERLGGKTVNTLSFDSGNTSQRDEAIVNAVAGAKPQYVLFFSSRLSDSSDFLTVVRGLPAYADVPLFLSDTAANPDLLTNANPETKKDVFPRITGSRPTVPGGPVFDLFKASYTAAFQQDPSTATFVPHAYDATWLAFYGTAYALRVESKVTGSGIARGIRRVTGEGPEVNISPGNWQQISNDVSQFRPVNVTGASGRLDYDRATEETTGRVDIWKIDNEQIVPIETIDPGG